MSDEEEWWRAITLNAVIILFVVFIWLGVYQFGQMAVWCMLKIKEVW